MTLIASEIAIFSIADGTLAVLAPKDTPLRSGQGSVALPSGYTPETFVWNTTTRTMVEDLAKLKAVAIRRLKDEAELLKMQMMTPGGAKKEEYAANKAEVRDADQLGGALLTTIGSLKVVTGGLEARFPQAAANAAEFGDTIQDALNRFRGGIARAAPCPKISAREARVCADIRASTTRAAFDAILAKHRWPS